MGTTKSGMTDHGALVLADVAQEPLRRRVAEFEDAARLLTASHDVGDIDGEARGWIALRAALSKSKEAP